MILTGEGTLDLRSEALDLDFDTATRQPSLASLAVPFKLGGTLKNPKVSADAVGAATGAVENLAGTASTTGEGVWGYVSGLLGGESGGGDGVASSPCVVAEAAPPAAPLSEAGATPSTPEGATPAAGSGDGSSPADSAPSSGEEGDKGIDDAFDDFKRDLGRIGDLFE